MGYPQSPPRFFARERLREQTPTPRHHKLCFVYLTRLRSVHPRPSTSLFESWGYFSSRLKPASNQQARSLPTRRRSLASEAVPYELVPEFETNVEPPSSVTTCKAAIARIRGRPLRACSAVRSRFLAQRGLQEAQTIILSTEFPQHFCKCAVYLGRLVRWAEAVL